MVERAGSRFADAGATFTDSGCVRDDIGKLRVVVDRVNRYTTTVIAHRGAAIAIGTTPAISVTWGDLDSAVDTMGEIHAR